MGVPGIETFDNKMLRYDNKRSLNRCVRIIARRHRGRSPTAVVVVVNVVVVSVVEQRTTARIRYVLESIAFARSLNR